TELQAVLLTEIPAPGRQVIAVLAVPGNGGGEAGGFSQYGVMVLRIGHIVVKRQPQRGAGPGGVSTGGDTELVEVECCGMGPEKLHRPGTVVQDFLQRCLRSQKAVVDGSDGDTGIEALPHKAPLADGQLVTGDKASAMDIND